MFQTDDSPEVLLGDINNFLVLILIMVIAVMHLPSKEDSPKHKEPPPRQTAQLVSGKQAQLVKPVNPVKFISQDEPVKAVKEIEPEKPVRQVEQVKEQKLKKTTPSQLARPAPAKGFSLEIASDKALEELTASKIIAIWSLNGKEKVCWIYRDGWELDSTPAMPLGKDRLGRVPEALREAASGRGTTEFRVTMVRSVKAQIDQYMAEHKNGVLTLSADGWVSYSP